MDEDDILLGINLDEIEQQVAQIQPTVTSVPQSSSRTSNYSNAPTLAQPSKPQFPDDGDDDFEDFDYLNLIENEIKQEKNVLKTSDNCIPPSPPSSFTARKRPTPPSVSKFTASNRFQSSVQLDPPVINYNLSPSPEKNVLNQQETVEAPTNKRSRPEKNLDLIDYSHLFDSMDDFNDSELLKLVDQPEKKITILDDEYKFKINNHNLATIEELVKFTTIEKSKKNFIICAEIFNITAKFQIQADAFLLRVNLFDFTGVQMEV